MAALQIRIKDEQRDLIERGAKLRGESLSEFVRRAACAEAEYLEQERKDAYGDVEVLQNSPRQ